MKRSDKRMCIQVSKKLLEEFLFQNKVKIAYIETDPRINDIKIYIDNAGPITNEACYPITLTLEEALKEIKKAITECPQDQND